MNHKNNLGQRNALNLVLVLIILSLGIVFCLPAVYALDTSDFTSENTRLSVSSKDDVLYLELFNSNTLISNIDLSSTHSLEVTNLETGFTYKYFGGLIFPIEIPKTQGKYLFTLSGKQSNVISQIYLEYNSDDTFKIYDSKDKNIEIPSGLDESDSIADLNDNSLGSGETGNDDSNRFENHNNQALSTDKKEYVLGEIVNITVNIDSEIKDFYIMSETSKYLFTGYIPDGSPLTFTPMEAGRHRIILSSGGSNFESVFEVFDKRETDIMTRNYESLEQYMASMSEVLAADSKEIILRDSTGRSAFVTAVTYNTRRGEKQDPGAIDTVKGISRLVSKKSANVVNGIIDPQYVPEEYSLDDIYAVDISEQVIVDLNSVPQLETSKLELENVVVDVGADLEIRIETVPESKLSLQKNIIESFAMDFSNLEFDKGTFTKIATGEELWKCREWNYMQQRCNGDWVKIKDLTPGVEYSIEVSPVDPGYAETGVSTINADKPIYLPGEVATLNIAVLDKFGYLVNNAHLTVTVITPSSGNYVYTTETGDVYSISKGIYSMQFPHTEEEGDYTIIVSGYARIVNSTMISKFVVDSDYSFDIIRQSELSVDPYKGSYLMNIQVTPKLSLQNYDFTDKIPASIEILETNGEIIVNESGKFIQWNGLNDAYSAFYRYKAPFDIPSVLTFGPSSIVYDAGNGNSLFTEPREWYVAIDPEVPTDDGIMFYGDRTPDGGIKTRNWTSDVLYEEQYYGIDLGGRSSWMKARCSEKREQCVLGVSNNDDDFGFAVFHTNNWSFTSYGDMTTDLANNEVPWDIECESLSGDCLVIYENSQTFADAIFTYRIWNGSNLTAPLNHTITGNGSESQEFRWIKLYPKNGTDMMGVVVQNDAGGNAGTPAIYGGIWNGTDFTQWQMFTNNSITNADGYTQHKHFDCAWSSSRLYCIYSNESNPGMLMYQYNGTAWQNNGSIYNDTGGEIWEVSACGMDPWSIDTNDYIGFMACSNNVTTGINRVDGGIWNGTAFSKLVQNQTPSRNNNAECGTNKGSATSPGQNFRCQWESSGNQVLFMWVNSGQDYIRYGTYTKSSKSYSFNNWSVGNQIVVDGPSDIRAVYSVSNPFTDKVFLTYADSSRTAGCSVWTGNSWDGTGCNNSATFETDGARAASNWLTFDWFRLQLQPYINIVNPVITTTTKDYFGITNPSTTFIAWNGTSNTLPPAAAVSPANTTAEFSTACYFATTSSDDTYCMTNTTSSSNYTYQSFKFYVTESVVNIDSFKINYEGRGTNTTSSTPIDMRIYVYNFTSDSYVFVKTIFGGGGADSYTEATVEGRASDLVVNNSMYILIIPTTSSGPAALGTRRLEIWTDYISLDVNTLAVWRGNNTVNATAIDDNGVSYCDWRYYNTTFFPVNNLVNMTYDGSTYYHNVSDTTLIADGTYYIYVFCNDTNNVRRNDSVIMRIDNNGPTVNLHSPDNNINITTSFYLFRWNATDSSTGNMRCNITIDEVVVASNIVTPHDVNMTRNITGIADGTHYWNITCADDGGNIGYSENRVFDSDTAGPVITLNYPVNGSFTNRNPVDFNFTVTDAHIISNCSIYVDGVLNATYFDLTSGIYTLDVYNLTQGTHRWNVSCYDGFGFRTNSTISNFTVDYSGPVIYLNITDGFLFNGTTPRLNYTATDNIDTLMYCNITINSVVNDINISSPNNTLVSRLQTNLPDGFKAWFVTCWDDAGNINNSQTRTFQVIGGPLITLLSPSNATVGNGSNINFTYNVSDIDGVAHCSLYIDGIFNQTNLTIVSPGNNIFQVPDLSEGIHYWNISCNDSNNLEGRSLTYQIVSDRSQPTIDLIDPSEALTITYTPARFNFTFTDTFSVNGTCNLTVDGNVSASNMNFRAISGAITNRTQTLTNGIHFWNVTCMDMGRNFNTSVTFNFTVNVTFPLNVTVVADKIIYQENEIVILNVTIRNESGGPKPANFTLDYIYTNDTFSDVYWWNTSWIYRKPIFINESQALTRTNKPIAINLTFAFGEITSCTNHLRIIDDASSTERAFNVIAGDDVSYCYIIFNGSVSASASRENNYHVYYSRNGTNPNYVDIRTRNITFDLFGGASINTSIWNNSGWDLATALPLTGQHAHIDGLPVVTNATLRLNRSIDLTPYDSVNISFLWDITSTWDVGPPRDFLALEITNNSGTNWTWLAELNTSNQTSAAIFQVLNFSSTSMSNFLSNGFNIRFRATVDADAEEGGVDNFTIMATNNIQVNLSAYQGKTQYWLSRVSNVTDNSGTILQYYNTSDKTAGNYSAVVLASPPNANNSQGTGFDWFTIILDVYGPNITLIAPTNGITNHTGTFSFSYNVSDLANNVANCSLIFNGTVNQTNTTIIEGATNNFIVTMAEGSYNWTVRCFDDLGNNATGSYFQIYIDDTSPNIIPIYPDNAIVQAGNITFFVNVTDNLDSLVLCNLSIDSGNYSRLFNATSGSNQVNMTGITEGLHFWNVTCFDNINNNATSITLNFTAATAPSVRLHSPDTGYGVNSTDIVLYFNLSSTTVSNCSLLFNGTVNQTRLAAELPFVNNDGQNNFTLIGYDYRIYNWTVICFDTNGFNGTDAYRIFHLDNEIPSINLLYPVSDGVYSTRHLNFTFNVTDIDNVLICNLTIDGNVNVSNISVNHYQNRSVQVINMTLTNHNWSVTCQDNTGFVGTSQTLNFTLLANVTITLSSPANNTLDGDGAINFSYTPNSPADFTAGLCSLYIDGSVYDNHGGLSTGALDTFVETGIAEGFHSWYVNCTDNSGQRGVSQTRYFTVDLSSSTVISYYPDGDAFTTSTVFFNWTAIDNIDTNLTCNITVNGTILSPGNLPSLNNTVANATYSGLTDGRLYWIVTCRDDSGSSSSSTTKNFTVMEIPRVSLGNPSNNTRSPNTSQVLSFTPTDNSGNISACELILDGIVNETNNTQTSSGTQRSFTVNGLSEGTHNWTVNCTDPLGNEGTNLSIKYFTIDLTGPVITLQSPNEGQFMNTNNVTFNWTPVDYNNTFINCSIFVDSTFQKTVRQLSNTTFSTFVAGLSDGPHNWTINCSDDVNNTAISETRNFTINSPDLYVDNTRISFNNTNPDEGSMINITVNVTNMGGVAATNLIVDFWDGVPGLGTYLGNDTGTVGFNNGSRIFFVRWNITTGYHTINIVVDPSNAIGELSELNNNASANISILKSTINYPVNNTKYNYSNVTFNFTLQDFTTGFLSGLINYSVIVDNVYTQQNGTVNDGESNIIYINLSQGIRSVKIEAIDYLGRRKNSTAVLVVIDYTPPVPTINTANNTWFNISTPSINISATDNVDTNLSYTLYVNGTIDQTGNITSAVTFNRTLSALAEGYYELILNAMDDLNNTANSTPRFIYIDLTAPTITINAPANGTNFTTRSATLNFTLTDNLSPTGTCTVYLDGSNVSTFTANASSPALVNLNNLAEGSHTWNVSCYDLASNTALSSTSYFNTRIAPSLVLHTPANATWSPNSTNTFYFNVSDDTGLQNCSIIINGVENASKDNTLLTNNATNNFTLSSMTSGTYVWAVQCFDNTTFHAYNITSNRTFYVDLVAPVPVIATANNAWFNTSTPQILFNITDNMDVTIDYTIYVNGTPNTVGTVANATTIGVNLAALTNGTYSIVVGSFDNAGNFQNSSAIIINVDTLSPSITINSPANNTNLTVNFVAINFTPTDNMASFLMCNVTVDGSVTISNLVVNNGASQNATISGLSSGYHYWNVTCLDQALNRNTSLTYVLYVVTPDIYINESEVYFSNNNPVENETVNVTATIRNIGQALAANFTVQIRLNSITGTIIYNTNHTLNINETINISANHTMTLGNTTFYIMVDTPLSSNGSINESDEYNNNATRSLYVGLWQYILGNTNDRLSMTDRQNGTIFEWLVSNASGSKIFAADIDSNINWRGLRAIGINATNQSSTADFATIDTAFGSTNFTDSINRTYTAGGSPKEAINYTLFARPVYNVPIVNSTNNTNFKTGILWDYVDGGSRFNGTQDLIFVSPINKNTQGYNATVDYEIRVPASLRSYKTGSDLVVFYAEIG